MSKENVERLRANAETGADLIAWIGAVSWGRLPRLNGARAGA
jgi:hypothetical protein